ncbi:MAG: 2-thiouracil desulfurase family protein [Hyphomicrobiales bacterium]|nr:2-thiouracil desulfurase family protein [Hyphomicrobiales bacterium]
MDRILISACLIGWPVRYDGAAKTAHHPLLEQWAEEGRLVPLCPETMAGMTTPRAAAEIAAGASAEDVLAGRGRLVDAEGGDPTAAFVEGARLSVAMARVRRARFALMTEGSPSCGTTLIADGTFSGKKRFGEGVAARALRDAGVEVFALDDIEALSRRLDTAD